MQCDGPNGLGKLKIIDTPNGEHCKGFTKSRRKTWSIPEGVVT